MDISRGEKNEYALLQFMRDFSSPDDKEGTQKFQKIVFYRLNLDGSYENGTTLEEMLRVCNERLAELDSRFPCEENKKAGNCIEEARKWLEVRTADRKERGVEGKHEA